MRVFENRNSGLISIRSKLGVERAEKAVIIPIPPELEEKIQKMIESRRIPYRVPSNESPLHSANPSIKQSRLDLLP
jgi:hypothetical protein